MVKAKDFLDYFCNSLDIKLFSGIVCNGLLPIFNKMNSNFMHYIPTILEKTAHGIICGAGISGSKASLIFDYSCLNKLDFSLNINNKIPLCAITYLNDNIKDEGYLNHVFLSEEYKHDLDVLNSLVFNDMKIGVLVIKEGVMK